MNIALLLTLLLSGEVWLKNATDRPIPIGPQTLPAKTESSLGLLKLQKAPNGYEDGREFVFYKDAQGETRMARAGWIREPLGPKPADGCVIANLTGRALKLELTDAKEITGGSLSLSAAPDFKKVHTIQPWGPYYVSLEKYGEPALGDAVFPGMMYVLFFTRSGKLGFEKVGALSKAK